jgi:hypothetical protein
MATSHGHTSARKDRLVPCASLVHALEVAGIVSFGPIEQIPSFAMNQFPGKLSLYLVGPRDYDLTRYRISCDRHMLTEQAFVRRVANGSTRGVPYLARACPAEVTGQHRHYITLPRTIRFQPSNARIRTLFLMGYIA